MAQANSKDGQLTPYSFANQLRNLLILRCLGAWREEEQVWLELVNHFIGEPSSERNHPSAGLTHITSKGVNKAVVMIHEEHRLALSIDRLNNICLLYTSDAADE